MTLLLEDMSKSGIRKSILIPFESYLENELLLQIKKNYEEKFYIFGMINFEEEGEEFQEYLDGFFAQNIYDGIKIHSRYQGISLHDNKVSMVVKLAGRYNIPVMFDGFMGRGRIPILETHPYWIDKLAFQYPDTSIIIAHMGGSNIMDCYAIVQNNKNVFLDLSATLIKYDGSSVIYDIEFLINTLKGTGRLIFGSDYPTFAISDTLKRYKMMFDKLSLSLEDQEQIFCNNIKKLLDKSQV